MNQTATPTIPNLRAADLIAKTAKVTLKDTLRVLIAADLAAFLLDTDFEDMLDKISDDMSAARPQPENIAACEQAYFQLQERLRQEPDMRRWAEEIRNFK